MNIASVLNAELDAAAADLERGCDRAADAATVYIVRRLQQLERHFPRHKFVYVHRGGAGGLYVYPQVHRCNCVATLMRVLCGRAVRWRTMRSLFAVVRELNGISYRIQTDFERLLGVIEAGGVTLPRFVFKPHANDDATRAYDNRMADRQASDRRRFNRPTIYRRR